MQIKHRDKWDGINVGDKRIISKFAWLPVTCGDTTKWLERVTYVQEVTEEIGYASMDYNMYKRWSNLFFIDLKR